MEEIDPKIGEIKIPKEEYDRGVPPAPPRKAEKTVMPNEPCLCGSGKKNKHCDCEQYH
jgi:preprotein translocase subunit SecA